MKIKKIINKLFDDNTDYKNPSQATNQASSLSALSIDLYTDSKRFIYELLQNADDSSEPNKTVKVWIKTFDDLLVVAHTGKAFDARDLKGLCNINNGTKKDDTSKTGYKGIGFKSVFGQSERVTIFTNKEYFRFDSSYDFEWSPSWKGSQLIWEEENDRDFVFPWQIIPIYTERHDVLKSVHDYLQSVDANVATIIKLKNKEETTQAIQRLSESVSMFLFLKNISEISFDICKKNIIEINRSEINKIVLSKNGTDRTLWLTSTVELDVPSELRIALQGEQNIPDKLLTAETIELTLAAKLGDDGIAKLNPDEKLLYSYLPTEETKYSLPVLVNASFLTNANREQLHADSKWNQWIFKNIAIEIFLWISRLVTTKHRFQAYELIPEKMIDNELGRYFNEGVEEAIGTVKFVMSKQNKLVRIGDSIIDFTFLSEKEFITEESVKTFLSSTQITDSKVFVKHTKFSPRLRRLGSACFEWSAFFKFLQSESFLETHTVKRNIALIKHLKYLSEKENVKEITIEKLHRLPFIWDHKDILNLPVEVYFPTAEDTNWDTPLSDLSFLHKELQDWLSLDSIMRTWVEQLGVIEKTDISFITKTIIPNVEDFITEENAIQTILDLFNLYSKDEISSDLFSKLSNLNLLTRNGSLVKARECYFSNSYSPRLEIEEVLAEDLFISDDFLMKNSDKDEWKRFFKFLGVNERISTLKTEEKTHKRDFIFLNYFEEYFDEEDKRFKPYLSTFTSDSYKEIVTLNFIQNTIDNYSFSKVFWNDVIVNISASELTSSATAYWGNSGYYGQINGDEVENYVPWFIKKMKCIPVETKECLISSSVFLNSELIKSLAGCYLPVFDGPELSPDWRSFFSFKTSLHLTEYLNILNEISGDTTDKDEVLKGNAVRIQAIYNEFLRQCINWGQSELHQVSTWADSGLLLNTKKKFTKCTSLKYFLDGNNSIFQDQFHFLEINTENKRHVNFEILLKAFNITLLRQSDFELIYVKKEFSDSLTSRLYNLIPYLKVWVSYESLDEKTQIILSELDKKIINLKIYEAESLQIKYGNIDFTKNVNLHFDENELFVMKPWGANKVLLQLSEELCRYFSLIGHDKKLDFLLRSTNIEILEYFNDQQFKIPEKRVGDIIDDDYEFDSLQNSLSSKELKSFDELEEAVSSGSISPEFFHIPTSTYGRLQSAQRLISRAVQNVIKYLSQLSEYDCSNCYEIAPSIIGGITKNGRDMTIVARPSDNQEVLLYYTSEFDVLEYVDAEFWCEDGSNVPHKITLGMLLKMTKINKIPISSLAFTESEFEELLNKEKSINYDFNAVPFAPYKIAQIISSFANTEGGCLIFGINEITPTSNVITGLSTDFRVEEIVNKAISFLSPIPEVSYDWVSNEGQSLFVIETKKSTEEIILRNQKFMRLKNKTILEEKISVEKNKMLTISKFDKTVAIVIGIENYAPKDQNQIPPVRYAENDANLFKEILIRKLNVKEENIHLLLGDRALRSNLQYDLKGLFHELTSDDRLIFYYVGHGFHNGITNYLSTYDMHPLNIDKTAISLRDILLDPLSKSKCRSAMIFIDACAQSFQEENSRNNISNLDSDEITLLTSEHDYLASYFSCQPGQSSYSCDDLKQGIWTQHLVKAIGGEVPEAITGKYITDRLLSDYLGKSVAEYVQKKLGYNQNPKAILDSSSENVIVEVNEG